MRVTGLPIPSFGGLPPRARNVGIVSTFPPTACGLATFSAALADGLCAQGADVRVVRVADGAAPTHHRVIGDLVNDSPSSVASSIELLNQCDVAVVQHEYGLYGGIDGDEVLEILEGLRVPSIVIAHTVLNDPTPHQRSVLIEVAELADQLVVMSEAARERLSRRFDLDQSTVAMIPHGAAIPARRVPGGSASRPTMLTWGLIGPGKGIERMVDAMPSLHRLPMRPRYLVAGRTHPKVLAAHGESYREARAEQSARLGCPTPWSSTTTIATWPAQCATSIWASR